MDSHDEGCGKAGGQVIGIFMAQFFLAFFTQEYALTNHHADTAMILVIALLDFFKLAISGSLDKHVEVQRFIFAVNFSCPFDILFNKVGRYNAARFFQVVQFHFYLLA